MNIIHVDNFTTKHFLHIPEVSEDITISCGDEVKPVIIGFNDEEAAVLVALLLDKIRSCCFLVVHSGNKDGIS